MTDSMLAVMKRIHEIRSRFGLRQSRAQAPGMTRQSYRDFYDRAAEPKERGVEETRALSAEEIARRADHYAALKRVPPALVRAVIETESGFNPRAVSPKGAIGLMQLMPSIVKERGVRDPFDPDENLEAGTGLLADLLREYGGDYAKALAAYHAGRGAVNRSGGVPDIQETKEYVRSVIERYLKNAR